VDTCDIGEAQKTKCQDSGINRKEVGQIISLQLIYEPKAHTSMRQKANTATHL